MKRTLSVLLSLLLCVALLLSFTACGDKKDDSKNDDAEETASDVEKTDEEADDETDENTDENTNEEEQETPEDTEQEESAQPDELSIVGKWGMTTDAAPMIVAQYASVGMNVELDSFMVTYVYNYTEDGVIEMGVELAGTEEEIRDSAVALLTAVAEAQGVTYEEMVGDSEDEFIDEFMDGLAEGMEESLNAVGTITYEFNGTELTTHMSGVSTTVPAQLTATTLSYENDGVPVTLTRL